jgi:transcriptional regulator GlxA family with amidase domain
MPYAQALLLGERHRMSIFAPRSIVAALFLAGLISTSQAQEPLKPTGILQAGFIVTAGVFNSELFAPYDVLEHSRYRDSDNYIACWVISQTGEELRTAEGIIVKPHHSFESAPRLDIVILPSGENSMEGDLANEAFITWIRKAIDDADWVMSLCDGAFPLAATGHLDGRVATTFPGDRERFAAAFPKIDVRFDLRFVVDGKFITSVGGAPSYEPAFWLVEHLYGVEHAQRTGQGLVVDWDADSIEHLVVDANK